MPLDPARLDQLAAEIFADAREEREAGHDQRALELYARAETLQAWAARDRGLTVGKQRRRVERVHAISHRQKLSESRFPDVPDAENWLSFARKAKLPSLRAVATALGVTPAFISQISRGKKKMPPDKAKKFEELTGFPATLWPT